MDVISHPSFATLHAPESRGNDEHPGRLRSLLDRFPDHVVGEPAPRSRLEARALRGLRRLDRGGLERGLARSGHVRHRDDLGGGMSCRRVRDRGRLSRRLRAGSPAWAPRARVGCDGLLHLRERRHCRPVRAARARARASRRRRLRRSPWKRHGGAVRARPVGAHGLAPPVAVLARDGWAGVEHRWHRERPARRPALATTSTAARSTRWSSRLFERSIRSSSSSRQGSMRIATIRSRRWR